MKSAWVVAVLLFVVVVSGASAQLLTSALSPRSLGMGGTGIGVADDAVAWAQNPAGLGAFGAKCLEGNTWANDALGAYGKSGDSMWDLSWSGWEPAKLLGAGAGYIHEPGGKVFGAGFGIALKNSPLSLGVNAVRFDPDMGDSETIFDLGALYQFARPAAPPIRGGLVVEDVTGKTLDGPFFDLGVAWPVDPKLLVAADVNDVTGKSANGPFFSVGAEYAPANEWKVRAGLLDTGDGTDLTLGAGYVVNSQWRVDGGWANTSPDKTWSLGAGYSF